MRRHDLPADRVAIWIDWQSIHQDHPETLGKGVRSLIKYTTLCTYMLIPVDKAELSYSEATYAEYIPNYGERSWCRIENFIFSLWAEMQPGQQDVQLYAVLLDGQLHQYPKVKVRDAQFMPTGGELTKPEDRTIIKEIEDRMIEAYGVGLVWKACEADDLNGTVELTNKMLRACHMKELGEALASTNLTMPVTVLNLQANELGVTGIVQLASVLSSESGHTLHQVNISANLLKADPPSLGHQGGTSLAEAIKLNPSLTKLNMADNKLLAGENGVALGQALATNPRVSHLNLNGNCLGSSGGKAIGEAMRSNSNLVSLSLSNNDLDGAAALAIADALSVDSGTAVSLKTLSLAHNPIAGEPARKLAQAIFAHPCLEMLSGMPLRKLREGAPKLDAQTKGLGPLEGLVLAELLKGGAPVSELNLRGNPLGLEGVRGIADALRTNAAVTTLSLKKTAIDKYGCRALAEVLRDNSTLRRLDLSENKVGSKGVNALAEAIKVNGGLAHVSLAVNKLDFGAHPDVGRALALAIKINCDGKGKLKTCDLRGNTIDDEAKKLIKGLMKGVNSEIQW